MTSIFFQIVGNIFLVWAIIFQKFSDISNDSVINVSDSYRKEKIIKMLKTKVKITIGLIYVIVGLLLSIPCIDSFIINISLFSNCCFNVILIILLFFIVLLTEKLFISKKRDEINKAVNERKEGQIWTE